MHPMRTHHRLFAATIAAAAAHTVTAFTIPWSTIDGGGARVANGQFALRGTVGQADAAAPRANGQYANTPGYWSAPPPPCLGDLNADRLINTSDLVIFLGRFGLAGAPGSTGDFNTDGTVNTADLVLFLGRFGQGCP